MLMSLSPAIFAPNRFTAMSSRVSVSYGVDLRHRLPVGHGPGCVRVDSHGAAPASGAGDPVSRWLAQGRRDGQGYSPSAAPAIAEHPGAGGDGRAGFVTHRGFGEIGALAAPCPVRLDNEPVALCLPQKVNRE